MYKLTQIKDYIIKVPTPKEPGVRVLGRDGVTMDEYSISFMIERDPITGEIAPVTPLLRDYKEWLDAGNEPLPADPIPEPTELTVEEKLERAGLSLDELRSALGL